MRAANITAAIATVLWFCLLITGRDGEGGVARRMGGSVNIGQFDFYVLWPAYVLVGLLACAWFCNALRRWFWLLGLAAGASVLALVPFLFVYGGGM